LRDCVTVEIKYLSALRDHTGRPAEEVSFPPGASLHDVAGWLQQRYALTLPAPQLFATLNGDGWHRLRQGLSTRIEEDDVICLFAPIDGG
jgi:molybdopterin converting factor small subunit